MSNTEKFAPFSIKSNAMETACEQDLKAFQQVQSSMEPKAGYRDYDGNSLLGDARVAILMGRDAAAILKSHGRGQLDPVAQATVNEGKLTHEQAWEAIEESVAITTLDESKLFRYRVVSGRPVRDENASLIDILSGNANRADMSQGGLVQEIVAPCFVRAAYIAHTLDPDNNGAQQVTLLGPAEPGAVCDRPQWIDMPHQVKSECDGFTGETSQLN